MKKALTFLGWPLIAVPSFLFWVGAFLNQIVIAINDGYMPVLSSYCTNFDSPEHNALDLGDHIHSCMLPTTRLKFLCDWLIVPDGIASIGDIFIWASKYLIVPCLAAWFTLAIYNTLSKRDFYLE